ncbi:Dicer-like protein 1 [Cladobotryum mycophilum]|uniref:Dicer-like protein 1 n=1 Tax=Cladobotryum mycophilum TaxID=491253 RepID=A0ABR0SI49_9HYPO
MASDGPTSLLLPSSDASTLTTSPTTESKSEASQLATESINTSPTKPPLYPSAGLVGESQSGSLGLEKLHLEEADDNVAEDDDENQPTGPGKPRVPTEKKRRENAAFESWLEKNQREVTKASEEDLKKHDQLSAARFLQDSTSKKIISSPREYQLDLFERAKEQNSIVVLDTGSGKTLIAALLLRHILEQELQDRSQGRPPKLAFFLVEKVALCFQQHGVLACNLEFPIGKFYGDMTGVARNQEFWDTQFRENMAVVCTPHEKNHPYARIITNHYLRELKDRPRILGMTASPVDAQVKDIQLAMRELETMLCSKIATISDAALEQSQAHRKQTEIQEYYHKLVSPEDSRTVLWEMIANCVGDNLQFRSHLEFAQTASSTLGTWCADRYWGLLMTDTEAIRLEARTGRDFAHNFDASQGDEAVAAVQRAKKLVREYPFKPISKSSPYLSSKVRTLHEVLEDAFCRRQSKRCIVFVQKRSTAFLLDDLFQQPDMHIPGMRATYMIGSNTGSASAANMSNRDQYLTLQKFRYGEINCIFATSVAEEGIDIPECDVIIRFDLFASAIQYIQSKGRARQKSSIYVSMIEEGNMEHLRRLRQASRDAGALRKFCSNLSEDCKVQDYVIDATAIAQIEHMSQKTYTITETGARLTFITSLEVLAKFVSSLPGHDQGHVDASPIKTAVGEPQRSKQLARCSAAFEACVELVKKLYIDTHLQPAFAKKLPLMRNARLAIKSDKKSEYEMRLKPDFWSKCLDTTPPTRLFSTVIGLDRPEALGRDSRPLVLLTRHPLPNVPSIPLFFGKGQASLIRPLASQVPIELNSERLEALAHFTLRIFADVFSKEYAAKPEEIPYFIAPFNILHKNSAHEGEARVGWAILDDVKQNEELSWENAPEDFFKDKLAIDPWDGSRKFILNGINKDLKPADPTPKGVPTPKSLAYRRVEQTIKEYSNSLSIKARQRIKWRDDQPVLNAELLSLRRNFLDEFFIDEDADGRCYVIPEPLRISPLPVDIVPMALILPVVMYRIDNALIALEACSLLGLTISPELALEAVTKDSFNTEEHGMEQVDFQVGMGKNYERLEFLGDTFLKMATTISVFTLMPSGDEFEYHVERMMMLCNINLFKHAVAEDRKLQEYIRSKAFDRRAWYPIMTLKRGKAGKTQERHCLSHKSIADVGEALIGAAYMSHMEGRGNNISSKREDMDMAVKAVTAMVNCENHRMTTFGDYYAAFKIPEWHMKPATAAQRLVADQVAEATGYRFQSAPLVRSAFTHPSYPFEVVPDYQRLEFLGDALLDLAVVDFLFNRFPEADPKWLTEHKMAMVSNQFQGCLCVKLGLHSNILFAHSSLQGDIREYAAQLEYAEKMRPGPNNAAEGGASSIPKNFWIDVPQPPKALADVVEALVGAMFVDSKYDYGVVRRFFRNFIQPYFEDMSLYDSFASHHPVTALAQRLQADFGCSRWSLHIANIPPSIESGVAVLSESDVVCALTVHEKVVFHATAKNGSEAKIAVSKLALKKFADLGASLFQAEMACNCGGPPISSQPVAS